jgi:uncharacterized protein (UPF0262 family)
MVHAAYRVHGCLHLASLALHIPCSTGEQLRVHICTVAPRVLALPCLFCRSYVQSLQYCMTRHCNASAHVRAGC